MKTIVRNTIFMGLFNVFGRASGVIRYFLLVHFLSEANYGLVSLALSFGEVGRNFMDGGLDNLISRDGARDYSKISRYLLHGLLLKLILCLLFFTGGYFYLQVYRGFGWSEILVVFASLIGSAMLSVTGVLRSCFTAIERMEYVLYTNIPARIISVFALFIVLWFTCPVIYTSLAISVENFIWFTLLGWWTFRFFSLKGETISYPFIAEMFVQSLPLALYQFFYNLFINLDVIMIDSIMGGYQHVAPFSYAGQLIKGILMLFSGYMIAIYPALSRYHKTDEAAYKNLFLHSVIFLMGISIPGSVMLNFWADGWANFIRETGPVSASVLRILAVTLNLFILNTLLIIVFTSKDKQWLLVLFTFASLGVSFTTNWIMIPIWGQVGAAYATLLSQIILFITMYTVLKSIYDLPFPIAKIIGLIGTSLAAGILTHAIPHVPLLLSPVPFLVLFFLFIRLFNVLSQEEIDRIWRMVKEK